MAMDRTCTQTLKSVVGFSFFSYFQACFFAGLFRRAINPSLSGL